MTIRRDPERLDTSEADGDAELKRALKALAQEKPRTEELARVRRRLEQAVSQAGRGEPARAPVPFRLGAVALAGAALLGALTVGPRLVQRLKPPAADSGEVAAADRRGQLGAAQPGDGQPALAQLEAPTKLPPAATPEERADEPLPREMAPVVVAPVPASGGAPNGHPARPRVAAHAARPARAAGATRPAAMQRMASEPASDAQPPTAANSVPQPAPSARASEARAADTAAAPQPRPDGDNASASSSRAEGSSAPAPAAIDEVSLLRQARQRASTDPEAALRLLNEHKRRFAHGTLSPEREVLAIELLRALSRKAEADRRAEAFRRDYPGSIYLPRVQP